MKKLLYIIVSLLLTVVAYGQQEHQITQYMFNKTYLNPAVAGINGALCVSGLGRNQWMGYQDENGNSINPQFYGISADMPIYRINSGIGLTINYNAIGHEKNIEANLLYAFHHVFKNNHMLSFGLNFGFHQKTIDYSMLHSFENDPLIQSTTSESGILTDVGLGLHYRIPRKFYIGLSTSNILASSAEIGSAEFTMARHYYLFSAYDFKLVQKKKTRLVLTPGFLLKATTGAFQLDLNAILTYNDLLWGGLVYRIENAVGIMAGFKYYGFSIGAAYDYTLSKDFPDGSRNSMEIFLKYCYSLSPKEKKRSGYNTRNL